MSNSINDIVKRLSRIGWRCHAGEQASRRFLAFSTSTFQEQLTVLPALCRHGEGLVLKVLQLRNGTAAVHDEVGAKMAMIIDGNYQRTNIGIFEAHPGIFNPVQYAEMTSSVRNLTAQHTSVAPRHHVAL